MLLLRKEILLCLMLWKFINFIIQLVIPRHIIEISYQAHYTSRITCISTLSLSPVLPTFYPPLAGRSRLF